MAGQEIRAFNVATAGFAAGLVGPSRSRIQGILVYATNITAFTIKNGIASGDHSAGLSQHSFQRVIRANRMVRFFPNVWLMMLARLMKVLYVGVC